MNLNDTFLNTTHKISIRSHIHIQYEYLFSFQIFSRIKLKLLTYHEFDNSYQFSLRLSDFNDSSEYLNKVELNSLVIYQIFDYSYQIYLTTNIK